MPLTIDALELEALVFVLSLIGYLMLIIVGLNVETPVLRQESTTHRSNLAGDHLAGGRGPTTGDDVDAGRLWGAAARRTGGSGGADPGAPATTTAGATVS